MNFSRFHRPSNIAPIAPWASRKASARAGAGTTLASSLLGDAISAAPSSKWKHPWFTQPAWSASANRWVATIVPGFVNEQAPVYRATVEDQRDAGNPWEINPLTGKPFFSDVVFSQPSTINSQQSVDLPLYLNPAIPMDFRGIGFDGDPSNSVPQFFIDLGAAAAPKQSSGDLLNDGDALQNGILGAAPTPPANLRLLRACDFWVHQPRLALTSEVTLEPGIATGVSNVTQTLSVASAAASDVLRVFQGTFTPLTPFTAGIDPLQGDYEEPTFDELLISTVYLLSPPNTPIGSTPDATWTPYVRHNLFWNLYWAQPAFRILPADPGVPLIPPLAGGAAQLVINFLTASINDATQQALNILRGHSLAGTFWTPTGGGKDATFAALATAQAVKQGPDRTANAAARLAADQAAKRAAQLDPDFPFNAQPFPTSFLSAA
ncbi:MAG: hypothetical protein P4L99_24100 [Chthoniobacter sp.]|nr:hypothetical protein [Chthoniobacter sp.]